jgi:hypothetical protein
MFDSRQRQDILRLPAAVSPGVEKQMHSTDHSTKSSAPFKMNGAKVPPPPYVFISGTATVFRLVMQFESCAVYME